MPRLHLRLVLALWAGILIVISARVLLSPKANSVYPIFSDAGRRWLASEGLYDAPTDGRDQFRYSPAVAAGFAAFAQVSDRPTGVAWRWLNAGVLLGALAAWFFLRGERPSVAAAMLLVLPLAVGGLNNGQCNALIAGLLLVATVALGRGWWTAAAAAVTVAVLFKGYPIVLGMLFCLVEPRRFTPRVAVMILAGFALPYLLQKPEYVGAQYSAFVERLQGDDRTAFPLYAGYRDLHMLLRLTGWNASLNAYRALEMILGIACAAVILAGRWRGWSCSTAVNACFALGACWMTLCGPATESSTYVLLAPVLAQAVVEVRGRPWPKRLLAETSFALFLVSAIVVWFPYQIAHPVQATGIQPLAALLLTVHVLTELRQGRRGPGTIQQLPMGLDQAA
jgi:hypothetical protein